MTEFVVGERRFRLEPMKIEDEAEVIYPNVMRLAMPVVEAMVDFQNIVKSFKATAPAAATEDDDESESPAQNIEIDPELISRIVAHIGKIANVTVEIPVVRKAFMKKCKVLLPGKTKGKKEEWVPLELFFEETFQRKHGLMMHWLAICVMTEFASFLDEIVQSLG